MLSNYLAAPAGLASPSILSVQARWISIGWNSPTVSGGLLTKYQIKALNARNTTLVIVADVTNTSLRMLWSMPYSPLIGMMISKK